MFASKKKRRRELMKKALSAELLEIVRENVPYFAKLTREDQSELQGLMQVFLDEKRFEGCGGLEITDEIRVTIAAQACVLLLHRETDFYPKLRSILVYPHAYVAKGLHADDELIMTEGSEARLGESWRHGSIVLSWDDVRRGAFDVRDGQNVVFHEFAHQLDEESSAGPGAPTLPKRSMYLAWARVLGDEYNALLDALDHHLPTLIDPYGATNPAEFFAVVSELFFERPHELKDRHPELYEQLRGFYQQDPARS
ncbi:MAG: zinc-dependent peptidase [Myxococcales bacterium]|nr:zinc-dependent peptidase [Myxococcales bacterium]MDH3483697.1 zinc-dependent peptidase [Myxococcales bacterium]